MSCVKSFKEYLEGECKRLESEIQDILLSNQNLSSPQVAKECPIGLRGYSFTMGFLLKEVAGLEWNEAMDLSEIASLLSLEVKVAANASIATMADTYYSPRPFDPSQFCDMNRKVICTN